MVNISTLILAALAVQDHARLAHLQLNAHRAPLLVIPLTMLEYVCLSVVMDLSLELKLAILAIVLQMVVSDAELKLDGPAQDNHQSADLTLPLSLFPLLQQCQQSHLYPPLLLFLLPPQAISISLVQLASTLTIYS